jgi:hypothetical protein
MVSRANFIISLLMTSLAQMISTVKLPYDVIFYDIYRHQRSSDHVIFFLSYDVADLNMIS